MRRSAQVGWSEPSHQGLTIPPWKFMQLSSRARGRGQRGRYRPRPLDRLAADGSARRDDPPGRHLPVIDDEIMDEFLRDLLDDEHLADSGPTATTTSPSRTAATASVATRSTSGVCPPVSLRLIQQHDPDVRRDRPAAIRCASSSSSSRVSSCSPARRAPGSRRRMATLVDAINAHAPVPHHHDRRPDRIPAPEPAARSCTSARWHRRAVVRPRAALGPARRPRRRARGRDA